MAKCNSCGASIEWALSEKSGKKMPVDAVPEMGGTILLRHQRVGEPPVAHVTTKDERLQLATQAAARGDELRLFKSHFASCPERDKWRKARA